MDLPSDSDQAAYVCLQVVKMFLIKFLGCHQETQLYIPLSQRLSALKGFF